MTSQIAIFVYKTKDQVSEFTYNSGALTFLQVGAPILQNWFDSSVLQSRMDTTQKHSITTTAAATTSLLRIFFSEDFIVPIIGTSTTIEPVSAGVVTSTIKNNSLELSPAYTFTPGTFKVLQFNSLANPYDTGMSYYPKFEFIDSALRRCLVRTFENLLINDPPNLTQLNQLIVVNDDQPIEVIFGTYTDAIIAVAAVSHTQNVVIRPASTYPNFDMQDFTLVAGETKTNFRIGHDLITDTAVTEREAFITFTYVSGNSPIKYARIRPLKVFIRRSENIKIKVTDFNSLPAGGRTEPMQFYLERAPFKRLTVGIF
jgi:hypothetical protein